jgi:hypothetical protein
MGETLRSLDIRRLSIKTCYNRRTDAPGLADGPDGLPLSHEAQWGRERRGEEISGATSATAPKVRTVVSLTSATASRTATMTLTTMKRSGAAMMTTSQPTRSPS